jgi:hypothetical protein
MDLKMVNLDQRFFGLIQIIKKVRNGVVEVKIQDGVPIRAYPKGNIDLNSKEEVNEFVK